MMIRQPVLCIYSIGPSGVQVSVWRLKISLGGLGKESNQTLQSLSNFRILSFLRRGWEINFLNTLCPPLSTPISTLYWSLFDPAPCSSPICWTPSFFNTCFDAKFIPFYHRFMPTSLYWTIFSNSIPLMIASMFETFIQTINMHYATNKEMMAGIGMATIVVHCVGGSLIHGFSTGFTSFASRAFGAQNKEKFKQFFVQGITNLTILMILFAILSLCSYRIILLFGQSEPIALYSYRTMVYHLPGICFFFISDFLWSFLNSQKVFKPVNYIFIIGLGLHITLSMTVSKSYGFNGIVLSTNITFFVVLCMTLYVALSLAPWKLSTDTFGVKDRYFEYIDFTKECFYAAVPHCVSLFMFQFMTLYLGSFKLDNQTAANIAATNFEGVIVSPHIGYSAYAFTVIGHYIGQNQPQKIKEVARATVVMSQLTIYSLILVSVLFKNQVASFYLKDPQTYKYFFILLNFFVLRMLFSALRHNGFFILRGLGLGSELVKVSIFCNYAVGGSCIIALCHYMQIKALAVWVGYFAGEAVMGVTMFYMYRKLDIERTTWEQHEKVKMKEHEFQTSPE